MEGQEWGGGLGSRGYSPSCPCLSARFGSIFMRSWIAACVALSASWWVVTRMVPVDFGMNGALVGAVGILDGTRGGDARGSQ